MWCVLPELTRTANADGLYITLIEGGCRMATRDEVAVLLLLHCETLNPTDSLRWRLDVPLNARGRARAGALGARVAAAYDVDVLLTSPLRRALETAAIVSAAIRVASLQWPARRGRGAGSVCCHRHP